jgi:Tol biopolymer transport system component
VGFIRPAQGSAITTTQLALSSSGSQADLASNGYDVTPDGKYVVFATSASTIVSGDTNGKSDIFVRDTANGANTRVSVSTTGTEGDGDSNGAIITRNGRYVLFSSSADNLATLTGVPSLPAAAATAGGYLFWIVPSILTPK